MAGDFQARGVAGTVGAVTIGIERVPVPVLPPAAETVMVGIVRPAGAERYPGEPVEGMGPGIVAAVRMPGETQGMVKEMVPGQQQAFYLPAVPLEPLRRRAGLLTLARVHSLYKNEHPPVALAHKIDTVAY